MLLSFYISCSYLSGILYICNIIDYFILKIISSQIPCLSFFLDVHSHSSFPISYVFSLVHGFLQGSIFFSPCTLTPGNTFDRT